MKVLPLPLLIAVGGVVLIHPLIAQQPGQTATITEKSVAPSGDSAAEAAADGWLAILDGGDYAASWESAATLFKKAVAKEKWVTLLKSRRPPLGKMLARKSISRQVATSLPNAPEGQYVVLQFDTSYEKKKVAVETVTCMLDTDGSWRVTGYLVR